jgi:hypothetical protein
MVIIVFSPVRITLRTELEKSTLVPFLPNQKLDSLFHEPFQQEPINDFDNDSHDNPLRLADGRMHQPIAIA